MDPIAWDIRYGLPNQKYIEYIDAVLLGTQKKHRDPFSTYGFSEMYVARSQGEAELTQSGNRIVLGRDGSGKTTAAQWLYKEILYSPQASVYQMLAANFVLPQTGARVSDVDALDDEGYHWTLSRLIKLVFDSYWNHVLVEPLKRITYLPLLRKDREWMCKLNWFYNHYPPNSYQPFDDFELFTWLHSPLLYNPFSPHIEDQDILIELIRFITTVPFDPREFGRELRWPYQKVRIITDCAREMSFRRMDSFMQDIQKLCDLSLPKVEFTVFINSNVADLVSRLPGVQSGHVSVYRLPQWKDRELQDILDGRIVACGGEFRDYKGNITNWGSSLSGLNPADRYHFRRIVIDGALRAYEQTTEFDAPIHALKLARGLLAACAGCWPERFPPPLDTNRLREIVNLYWEGEKGGKM